MVYNSNKNTMRRTVKKKKKVTMDSSTPAARFQ
jgi:hypothetical protein